MNGELVSPEAAFYFKKGNEKMKTAFKLFMVLCMALASTAVFAQDIQTKGSISGTVVDKNGAAIPNATVKVNGPEGERTATANDQGVYSVDNLLPGSYKVRVESTGFKAT